MKTKRIQAKHTGLRIHMIRDYRHREEMLKHILLDRLKRRYGDRLLPATRLRVVHNMTCHGAFDWHYRQECDPLAYASLYAQRTWQHHVFLVPEKYEPHYICKECREGLGKCGGDIYGGMCEDCSGQFSWCSYCEEDIHQENYCQHLYYMEGHGTHGCGSGEDIKQIKASLYAVLDMTGIAEPLLRSLRAHRYEIEQWGYIVGPGGGIYAYLLDESDRLRDYGDTFTAALTDKAEEAMADGVRWLCTLWAGNRAGHDCDTAKTPESDDATAALVEEYLALSKDGRAYYHLDAYYHYEVLRTVRRCFELGYPPQKFNQMMKAQCYPRWKRRLMCAALRYLRSLGRINP